MGGFNLSKFIIKYSMNGQHFEKSIAALNLEQAQLIAHSCAGKFTIESVQAA